MATRTCTVCQIPLHGDPQAVELCDEHEAMPTQTQHTPKYYYSADGYIRSTEAPTAGCVQGVALCKPGSTGTGAEQFKRRQFILNAVNAHDDMLAALKDAADAIEAWDMAGHQDNWNITKQVEFRALVNGVRKAGHSARAAIDRAERRA